MARLLGRYRITYNTFSRIQITDKEIERGQRKFTAPGRNLVGKKSAGLLYFSTK